MTRFVSEGEFASILVNLVDLDVTWVYREGENLVVGAEF